MTVLRTMILVALLLSLGAALAQESDAEVVISRERAPLVAKVKLSTVATGFERPLYVTHAGDGSGRLFLVEQSGEIWILHDGLKSPQPFLDVSPLITPGALTNPYTEQGLLGLAFHPNFRANGTFFVNYTDLEGDTAVARYHVSEHDPESADAKSGQTYLAGASALCRSQRRAHRFWTRRLSLHHAWAMAVTRTIPCALGKDRGDAPGSDSSH